MITSARISSVKKLLFLGTGASSSIPSLSCLLKVPRTCQVCSSAVNPGSLNRRRNVSLLIQYCSSVDNSLKTGIIDCGKTFYESCLEWLPRNGINKIDWVLLTHGHADAMFGLDELRHFNSLQECVNVYLSPECFSVVDQTFPYLTDVSRATGGGDVSKIKFHVFDPSTSLNFDGLEFIPVPVAHGEKPGGEAYHCLAFRFDNIAYISDCSSLSKEQEEIFSNPEILIVDTLREKPLHKSHFSLEESVPLAQRLSAKKTLLVGMCHRMDHDGSNEELKKLEIDIQLAHDGLCVDINNKD